AYALDKSIPKGEKMKPRAKSGFLVGYNSRNIYRILLLEEEMVIGTRDVIFNETQFYEDKPASPEDEGIPLIDFLISSPVPDLIFDIEDLPIRNNEPNSQTLDDDIVLDSKDMLRNHTDKERLSEEQKQFGNSTKLYSPDELISGPILKKATHEVEDKWPTP
ncbi:hypothetical protein K3495_g16986, partial [Podosphaera aphanis]